MVEDGGTSLECTTELTRVGDCSAVAASLNHLDLTFLPFTKKHLLKAVNMPDNSTEQSFRNNLSQFRWARGSNTAQQQQQDPAQGLARSPNPFSRFYNAIGGGYVPLRSNERSNEEEAYFALSRWERSV